MYESIAWAIVKIVAWAVASYYINQALNKRGNSNSPDAVNAKDWNFPQIDEGTPQCVFLAIVGLRTGKCWRMVTTAPPKSKKVKLWTR